MCVSRVRYCGCVPPVSVSSLLYLPEDWDRCACVCVWWGARKQTLFWYFYDFLVRGQEKHSSPVLNCSIFFDERGFWKTKPKYEKESCVPPSFRLICADHLPWPLCRRYTSTLKDWSILSWPNQAQTSCPPPPSQIWRLRCCWLAPGIDSLALLRSSRKVTKMERL